MSERLFKLKILWWHLCHELTQWRAEVWSQDLDNYYCCDGGTGSHNVCGCGGMTYREMYTPTPKQV